MFLSVGVSSVTGGQGDPPLLTEWWECSSALLSIYRACAHARPHLFQSVTFLSDLNQNSFYSPNCGRISLKIYFILVTEHKKKKKNTLIDE